MSSTGNVSEASITDPEIQQQRPKSPHRLRQCIVAAALFLLLLLTALFAIIYLHIGSISVLDLEELVLRQEGDSHAAAVGGALGGVFTLLLSIACCECSGKEPDAAETDPGPQDVQNTGPINNEPQAREPRP